MTVPVQDDQRLNTLRWLTQLSIGLIVLGCAVAVAVPAGLGWDFANFDDAGRRVLAGHVTDLYAPTRPIAGAPPQGTLGFFGAPLSAILYTPLGMLPPETALIVFKIENVLAFLAAFAVLFRFYRAFRPPGPEAAWQFAAAFTGLAWSSSRSGRCFAWEGRRRRRLLLLVAVAIVAHVQGRFWTAAACLVAAALIKPAMGPAVAFLTCASGWAFFWRVAVVGVVTRDLDRASWACRFIWTSPAWCWRAVA